jgi:hypothetical protein
MKTAIRKVSDANRSMEKAVPASPFPKNDCRNDPEKTDETTPQERKTIHTTDAARKRFLLNSADIPDMGNTKIGTSAMTHESNTDIVFSDIL